MAGGGPAARPRAHARSDADPAAADPDPWWARDRIDQVGGLLVHVAAPDLLRSWAPVVATMGDWPIDGMDYEYLHDPGDHRVDGEVQVFADYAQRVEVARVARAEVLAEPDAPTDPAAVRETVWARGAEVRARHRRAPRPG